MSHVHHTAYPQDLHLGSATARYADGLLMVDTGVCCRSWRIAVGGFATCSLAVGGVPWPVESAGGADWRLPGGLPADDAELVDLRIDQDDDEGFTARHLRVVAEFAYAKAGCRVRWSVWAWPDAPGLRTALAIACDRPLTALGEGTVTTECLPVRLDGEAWVRAIGYYAETQQRNSLATPLLREARVAAGASCTWASICAVERDGLGAALVKESHQCVNQPGLDPGAFHASAGLRSSGWGLGTDDLRTGCWHLAWAHWTLLYRTANQRSLGRALRSFWTSRYPAGRNDMLVMSNTWGSCADGRGSRDAARCDNVLRELASAADLGIEAVQIDDGWQVSFAATDWRPEPARGWAPHPEPYPDGWAPVRAKADSLGLHLGLWFAGDPVRLEEVQRAVADGGFLQLKLDFLDLTSHAKLGALIAKARRLIRDSGHRLRINWDVTEVSPRVGYFFAREYGALYLANRKTHAPASVIYQPCVMLRDAWQLARFQRLQSIQLTIQDPRRTSHATDAWRHGDAYCVAIALMGWPIFLQETQRLGSEARAAIRPLLAAWKQVRPLLRDADVEPIGDEPCNAAWTGFIARAGTEGLLMVFRELHNADPNAGIVVPDLAGSGVRIEDLLDGSAAEVPVSMDGRLPLSIPAAPGFRFLRYRRS